MLMPSTSSIGSNTTCLTSSVEAFGPPGTLAVLPEDGSPESMSELVLGLKRWMPKAASPMTVIAISTHLVVLLIVTECRNYLFFAKIMF